MRSKSFVLSLLFIMSFLSHGGCWSRDWRVPLQKVNGKILINGQTPEGLILRFFSLNAPVDVRDSKPWGYVKADGTYAMTTYKELDDGCPPGEYAVTIYWPQKSFGPGADDRLGNRYRTKETAPVTVSVIRGKRELPTIELNDIKVLPAK